MSTSKVYVGNLSFTLNDDQLGEVFRAFGTIIESVVVRHRASDCSRGFGFVTFGSYAEAEAAISGMNRQKLEGRRITVSMARSNPDSRSSDLKDTVQ